MQDKLAVLDQQAKLLGKIEAAATEPSSSKETPTPRPNSADWQKLLDFSGDNASRIVIERRALEQQREELARKASVARARIIEIHGQFTGNRLSKTVIVRVAAPLAGALNVTLAYALPGASWTPAYDSRLRSDERVIELTYFGVVRNRTGEDWKDVALTLSTARPNLGGSAPEPAKWALETTSYSSGGSFGPWKKKPKRPDPSQTVLGPDGGLAGMGSAGLSAADPFGAPPEASPAPVIEDASIATASVNASATSASFKIPTTATILSDNSPQKVGILTAKLDANLRYQATPKQLEGAFLSANTVNTTEFPLLAGDVGTFLDNTFVATSFLKTTMPGEKLTLDFGADEGVSIKRKLVKRLRESTGFGNKTARITHEVLFTLANNKRTTEHIVLKDVLPTSSDEKVVVKLLEPAEKEVGGKDKPGREVSREDDGRLVWRLDLKAGEKREIPLKFSIEHPADIEVGGLE